MKTLEDAKGEIKRLRELANNALNENAKQKNDEKRESPFKAWIFFHY